MAASSDNPNWYLECPLIDDISDARGDFSANNGDFFWDPQSLDPASTISSFVNSDSLEGPGSAKRVRSKSCCKTASKACREKMRRERLNDRFLELSSLLDPGNSPKTDKAAILSDACRLVTQLRCESQKLKESNESLQDKINELKSEKNELRDEKQRLKAEKESLEQQMKLLNAMPNYLPQLVPSHFAAQGQPAGHKLMVPIIGYPGFPMWQYMPPSDVDTSQDAHNYPPVA